VARKAAAVCSLVTRCRGTSMRARYIAAFSEHELVASKVVRRSPVSTRKRRRVLTRWTKRPIYPAPWLGSVEAAKVGRLRPTLAASGSSDVVQGARAAKARRPKRRASEAAALRAAPTRAGTD
jgi:hypothetical protein